MIWPEIPPEIAPWVYYLCVSSAVLIVGISKAGFGGGTGIVAVPVMAVVMEPEHMLGVLLPVLIAADVLSNLHYLKEYEWRFLRPLLAGAVGGVILGCIGFFYFQQYEPVRFQQGLKILIGAICLIFVALQVYGLTGRKVPTLPSHPASSVGVGALAGFVSSISHSAGPLVTLYLLQEKLEKRRLVGTLLFFFLLVNVAKVPTYVAMGTINASTLRDSIWFIPLIPVGTLAGAWMNKRVPEKPFVIILYAAAAITAGYVIFVSL